MTKIAFFNNKGGVGKTTLVYHLASMFADRGIRTLAADLDPQANLTSMCLPDTELMNLWESEKRPTIFGAVEPLMKRTGDLEIVEPQRVNRNLYVLPGDLELSRFEDLLSENWPNALDGEEGAFRILSSFDRLMRRAAKNVEAKLILIDVGPNLGAINRTALLAADYVIIPLSPDLFALQGLRNLGPALREWRRGWAKRIDEAPKGLGFELPTGRMAPLGYVIMQHGIRDSRPVKAYQRWMDRIPFVYRSDVLRESTRDVPPVAQDVYNLALLKHYRSLMPLAMEAHKPMFALKAADGAIGAHTEAVKNCYIDFLNLAEKIDEKLDEELWS
jgi:cellulose biosynthesis protein BcsQ